MALQGTIPKMISERDTAIGAFKGVAAFRTKDEIGKPPSIEEEQTLFLVRDIFLKSPF
jgi:hypothetical protein